MPENIIEELREVMGAVCTHSEIMLEIAKGNLRYEDDTRMVRSQQGTFNPLETDNLHWTNIVYARNPPLFNLVEMVYYLFRPLQSLKIEHYIDWKESQKARQ